jgi:hypothetical protein
MISVPFGACHLFPEVQILRLSTLLPFLGTRRRSGFFVLFEWCSETRVTDPNLSVCTIFESEDQIHTTRKYSQRKWGPCTYQQHGVKPPLMQVHGAFHQADGQPSLSCLSADDSGRQLAVISRQNRPLPLQKAPMIDVRCKNVLGCRQDESYIERNHWNAETLKSGRA